MPCAWNSTPNQRKASAGLMSLPVDQPTRQEMQRGHALLGSQGGYSYSAAVPATRPASDYTPRVVPFKAGAFVPLEADQILWQR